MFGGFRVWGFGGFRGLGFRGSEFKGLRGFGVWVFLVFRGVRV